MKTFPSPVRRIPVILVTLILGVVVPCRAAVDPADYLTITPIRAVGSTTNELGYAGSKINATSFKQQSLTTINTSEGKKFQFTSYYDNAQKLVVGRREMLANGWSDWYLRRTAFTANDITDSHDVSSIGIDGDGYLHVSWGMHGQPLLYTRSATSVLNDAPFSLIGDTLGNGGSLGGEITSSNNVTYPMFYNLPDSGDLLFTYRIGSSGNGDLQLRRWNNAAHSWNAVHTGSTPLINGDYTSPNYYGYTNYAAFDSQGNWHLTWTWRTGADSLSGFTDYQSNHNLMYAWSPNQGVDWYQQDGTLYQRSGVHAIDDQNATPVVDLPEGSSLINQTYMMTGPGDKVYVASWWAPHAADGDHLRQYMLAWQDGDTWRVSQITHRDPENVDGSGISQRVPETQLKDFRMTRPIVAVDDEDRVIVAFNDWQRGRVLTIAYSEDPDRNDWRLFDLTTEDTGSCEPSLDLNRWKDDGVISLFYQPTDLGPSSSVVSVLEWDARSYFAAVPEPGSLTLLSLAVVGLLGYRHFLPRAFSNINP